MKNQKINNQSIIFKLLFILAVVFLFSSSSIRAATSPDAIAFRVMPNPDHLSPRRWYQENIKLKGSPQGLTVDGYEAVRDGRTVYVNAANIDLKNGHCLNNQAIACVNDSSCVSGGTCVSTFYTNIYIISYNQQAENETVDIFAQILAHWKFNTNISEPEDNSETVAQSCLYSSECPTGEYCLSKKAKIIRDTKRLADLADIELVLDNYQKAHNGDYPALAAGSYVASTSLSVWPSWQATLAKELAVILPVDPVNRLVSCPVGYDQTTCWDQKFKKFAGIPANSQVYVYTYNGKKSYNTCALMESGYLTTLQGACAGSAVGYKVTCVDDATAWTSKYNPANVCKGQKIVETSNCGNTRVVYGGKITGECCIPSNPSCTVAGTCAGVTCNNGCVNITGIKTDGLCACTPTNSNCAANTCVGSTCNTGCVNNVAGTKCCIANQPSCQATTPPLANAVSVVGSGGCPSGQTCYKCQANYTWDSGSSRCMGCGDGTQQAGEACDCGVAPNININCSTGNTDIACVPGYSLNGSTCSYCDTICTSHVVTGSGCGDGTVQTANGAGEECDDSNTVNGDGCDSNCRFESRIVNCASMPTNAGTVWNDTSSVTQVYSASGWPALPATIYNNISKGDCHFKCDTANGYSRDDLTSTCAKCGDGVVNLGLGEVCDGTVGPDPLRKDCKVRIDAVIAASSGMPDHCIDNGNTVNGKQTCNSTCSAISCVANTPITAGGTSTLCESADKPLSDYACCELTKCTQDGCACCGRGKASLVLNFTSISTMDVDWELWGSGVPPRQWDPSQQPISKEFKCPIACQRATACGQYDVGGSCSTFIKDALGKDTSRTTSNNCRTESCRLSQDLRSKVPGSKISATTLRNWSVSTRDSTAYYKCWE